MTGDLLAGYIAGLQAGYAARCREEAEAWQRQSRPRLYVGGQFYDRPTAAERRAEREAILIEAHYAGLHQVKRLVCPKCRIELENPPPQPKCDGHCSGQWQDPDCSWHGRPRRSVTP